MKLFQTGSIPALVPGQWRTCETCALTKSAKTTNRDVPECTARPLQREYTDFWGPFGVPTPGEAGYILTFTDDLHATVLDLPNQDSCRALREVPTAADDGRALEEREITGDSL
jgi:hypothetical protein